MLLPRPVFVMRKMGIHPANIVRRIRNGVQGLLETTAIHITLPTRLDVAVPDTLLVVVKATVALDIPPTMRRKAVVLDILSTCQVNVVALDILITTEEKIALGLLTNIPDPSGNPFPSLSMLSAFTDTRTQLLGQR